MNRKETLQAATAVALVMGLAGCGGGNPISTFGGPLDRVGNTGAGSSGGNLGASNSSGTYNLQAGIANMVAHGLSVNATLSGSLVVNGTPAVVSGTGVYALSAGVGTTFNGTSAVSQNQTFTTSNATLGGQPFSISANLTSYYTSGTSEYLGQTTSTSYAVAQAPFQYPTSVESGMTGTLGTILLYSDSTMSQPEGSALVTYDITAPTTTGGPVSVTITTTTYDTNHAVVETDNNAYSMTSANVISFMGLSTQTQQGTLALQAN